jgi:hypothetical protein
MIDAQGKLLETLQSPRPVEGFTHNFYRYPARFAPEFVREVVLEFSREGDCVLDAFMGGGTTIVEAIVAGRSALGIDINPLAHFITEVKTTPLSWRDQERILHWVSALDFEERELNRSAMSDPRLRNVPEEIREILVRSASTINQLEFPRQRHFARCALIKLGQWAIDCRRHIPLAGDVRRQLQKQVVEMLKGLDDLVQAAKSRGVPKNKITSKRMLYCGSIDEIMRTKDFARSLPRPKLVLTSPPYPGVHMLYHRWQVDGRRETPAPYWLADLRDGHGASYFTLGGRSTRGLRSYFTKLRDAFWSLRQFIDPSALIVQLVAFSDPDTQLPAFLDAMCSAGYEELTLLGGAGSQRPSRTVPNRKWYTQLDKNQYASNEVLLFHRLLN